MITFTARVKALPGKEAEAAERMKEMVDAVKANEPGALAYICHAAPGKPGEFLFYEIYADEPARKQHAATPHFKQFISLMGTVLDAEYGAHAEDLERIAGFWRA